MKQSGRKALTLPLAILERDEARRERDELLQGIEVLLGWRRRVGPKGGCEFYLPDNPAVRDRLAALYALADRIKGDTGSEKP